MVRNDSNKKIGDSFKTVLTKKLLFSVKEIENPINIFTSKDKYLKYFNAKLRLSHKRRNRITHKNYFYNALLFLFISCLLNDFFSLSFALLSSIVQLIMTFCSFLNSEICFQKSR